jgi:ribonuclease BN (tRNA processing enzyme)
MNHNIFIKHIIEKNKIQLAGTNWYIMGDSCASRSTILIIPELNIAFDAGITFEESIDWFFISHVHADHTKGLPEYILNSTQKNPMTVIVPQPVATLLKNYVITMFQMTKNNLNPQIYWNVIEAQISNKFINLKIKNIDFKIEIIKCYHSTPTNGYGFIELRTKLMPIFAEQLQNGFITKQDIDRLYKGDINITSINEIYHFCYLGDTDHNVFYLDKKCTIFNPQLEKYKTIIIECTFLNPQDYKTAKKKKHMYWPNLKIYILAHPHINFILFHFSMKYTYAFIKKFFENENIPNIILLIHDWNAYKNVK